MKRYKILFIQTPSFNKEKGGVQRITYNLGQYFTKKGYEVDYFSFADEDHEDVKYGRLYHGSEKGGVNNGTNIHQLSDLISENAYDIIINQMPYEKKIRSCIIRSNKSAKTIACIHNSLFSFKSNARDVILRNIPFPINNALSKRPAINAIQYYHKLKHANDLRKILSVHDHLLLYTPPNHEELTYFIGAHSSDKIGYMPNPVAPVSKYDHKSKEKVVLHVGRLNIPQKRSDLLPEVWKYAQNKIPGWKFVIVGDGPYYKELSREIKQQKLENVVMTGFQNPKAFYRKASIFIMPSAFEGFPNTIIEAQSYGCPVIAFNSYGAISWILNDRKDGVLVPPFEAKQMADELVSLAHDRKRLNIMQTSAFKNVSRFGIERVGQQWQDLFITLLD